MKKLKQKGIGGIVSTFVYILMGVVIGLNIGYIIDNAYLMGEELNVISSIFLFLRLIAYFYLSMTIQVIIHEGGHLIFGILSGYKFLSFRIFDFILVRHENKLIRKKYSIPGTAGQCLMWPPEYNGGDFPYLIYNLGGGVMNIIVSTLILSFAQLMETKGYLYLFLIFVAYSGYAMAAINLIPMRMNGLSNDGKNIVDLIKNPKTRGSFWRELYINAATTSGRRYSDIDPSVYDITCLEINNMVDVYVYAVNADVCMEKGEYEKALEIVDMLLEHPVVKGSSYSNSLKVSKACLMMDLGYDEEQVKEVISEDVLKYVNTIHYMPSAKIFEYKYELYINKDINAALIKEEEFMKSLENSPNLGVNELEKQLFLSFKEKYFAKYSESDYNVS